MDQKRLIADRLNSSGATPMKASKNESPMNGK
jgi:hypothetical protein